MKLSLLFFVLLLISACKEKIPAKVRVENGSTFLIYADSTEENLRSNSGTDLKAALSPDGNKVAILQIWSDGSLGKSPRDEDYWILLYDIKAQSIDTIVKGAVSNEPEKSLSHINHIAFSPNGNWLYFTTAAWVTSGAIHRYDMNARTESFLTSGNSLKVIPSGKYKGYLIVSKHKYYEGQDGGSYDHYWLLDADGKEIKDIGDSEDGELG